MSGFHFSVRLDRMIEDYQQAALPVGLHRWDPRLKLALLVIAVTINIGFARLGISLTLLGLTLLLLAISRVPWQLFALFFLAPAWATLIVIFGYSVGFGTVPLLTLGPVVVHRDGLVLGLAAGARVACDMGWMAAVFLTTPFHMLLEAFRWYRVPPVLVEASGMAYRYAFMLADEAYRMIAAARARGGFAGFRAKVDTTAMILAQIVLRAYDRAARLQESMNARGAHVQLTHSRFLWDDEKLWKETLAMSTPESAAREFQLLARRAIEPGVPILECRKLSFSYLRGGNPVLDTLDLRVAPGEIVVLCGPNGCGKSTLLKLICGVLKPLSGAIDLLGRPLDEARRNEAFHDVGMLFQDPNDQVFCTHVLEDVAYGPRNAGVAPAELAPLLDIAMALTEVTHLASRPVHQLSFGEMRRVGLAGLIAMRQPLLLLDEPSAYLDPAAARKVMEIIQRLNREYGYTFVIVTHDMEFAAELASRVVVLERGRISADGVPHAVLGDLALLRRARLEPPVLTKLFAGLAHLESGAVPVTIAEGRELLERWPALPR